MSVLFKALSRAAEQDRQRQAAAAAQAVPVFHASPSGGRRWRVAFLAAVAGTALFGVGGLWLIQGGYADRLLDAPPPRPAAPAAPAEPAPIPTPAQTQASAPAPQAPPVAADTAPPAVAEAVKAAVEPTAPAAPETTASAATAPAPNPEPPAQTTASEPHGDVVAPDADLAAVLDGIRRRQLAKATGAPVNVQRAESAQAEVPGLSVRVHETSARDDIAAAYEALVQARFEQALALYNSALDKEPRNVTALVGRASVLHKLGRLDEARIAYDRALSADPTNTQALGNLLALIAASAPQDALAELTRLRAQNPSYSPIPAQIASVHARIGNVAEAVAHLREAIALSPENTLYRYNLAVLLDRAGRAGEAAEAYEKVLAAGPETLPLDQIRERLRFLRGR